MQLILLEKDADKNEKIIERQIGLNRTILRNLDAIIIQQQIHGEKLASWDVRINALEEALGLKHIVALELEKIN